MCSTYEAVTNHRSHPQPPTTTSTTRTITLRPFWEWRFEVSHTIHPTLTSTSATTITTSTASTASTSGASSSNAPTVRLVSGTAERDGTELAQNRTYALPRSTKSKILTYTGAVLEVAGDCQGYVAQCAAPQDSPQLQVLNLHFALQQARQRARGREHGGGGSGRPGPRVMVCGPRGSGKTTVVRTLAALATRTGGQPLVASVDPGEGLLALPGTVSAAVYGTVMDVEDPAGGFGVSGTPSSGPSTVPVKLPMVYYFGSERVDEDAQLWRDLTAKLASSVRAKFAADEVVREAGLVLDTPAVTVAKADMEMLMHTVTEFAGRLRAMNAVCCEYWLTGFQ